eukprot:56086_1
MLLLWAKKKKVILCGFIALLYTWFAIDYQFFALDESDYKIEIEFNKGTHIISLISLLSSSSKILSLFFWKQTIKTFQRGGKAVSLTIIPTIKWINSNMQNKFIDNSTYVVNPTEIELIDVAHSGVQVLDEDNEISISGNVEEIRNINEKCNTLKRDNEGSISVYDIDNLMEVAESIINDNENDGTSGDNESQKTVVNTQNIPPADILENNLSTAL